MTRKMLTQVLSGTMTKREAARYRRKGWHMNNEGIWFELQREFVVTSPGYERWLEETLRNTPDSMFVWKKK